MAPNSGAHWCAHVHTPIWLWLNSHERTQIPFECLGKGKTLRFTVQACAKGAKRNFNLNSAIFFAMYCFWIDFFDLSGLCCNQMKHVRSFYIDVELIRILDYGGWSQWLGATHRYNSVQLFLWVFSHSANAKNTHSKSSVRHLKKIWTTQSSCRLFEM